MRKTFLTGLAGVMVIAGVAGALATSPVSAAPAGAHVGDILPGALSDWNGPAGWAQANATALAAQGLDAAQVGSTDGATGITTNPAAGTVAVPAASCAGPSQVGYAVGDASGTMKIKVGTKASSAVLTPKASAAALFGQDEALSLVPPLTMTVDPASGGSAGGDYLINVQQRTITPNPGNPDFDQVVADHKDAIIALVLTNTTDELVTGLNNGVAQAFANDLTWTTTFDQPFPVSFAHPFGTTLASGQTATVNLAQVLQGSWVGDINPDEGLATNIPAPVAITDLTLANVLPASAPGQAYAKTVKLGDALWTALSPALKSTLDNPNEAQGVWLQAADIVRRGINAGLAKMEGDSPLAGYDNTISFTPVPTVAGNAAIDSSLKAMTDKKVADWKNVLQVTAGVQLFYQPGAITHLSATGVTHQSLGATLTPAAAAVAVEGPGYTKAIRTTLSAPSGTTLPTGTPTYAYVSSNTAAATIDQSGVLVGVAPGTTTVTATATWSCASADPVSATTSVAVTVGQRTAPVVPAFCPVYADAMAQVAPVVNDLLAGKVPSADALRAAGQQLLRPLAVAGRPDALVEPLTFMSNWFTALGQAIASTDVQALDNLTSKDQTDKFTASANTVQAITDQACTAPGGDTTPPAAPQVTSPADKATVADLAALSGQAEKDATISASLGTTELCRTTAGADGAWTCDLPAGRRPAAGTYQVAVRAADASGNASPATTLTVTVRGSTDPAPSGDTTPSAPPPAGGCPVGPITVGQTGDTITFTAKGYEPGTSVQGAVFKAGSTTPLAVLPIATADNSGAISLSWNRPAAVSGAFLVGFAGPGSCTMGQQFTLNQGTLATTGPGPATNVWGLIGLLAIGLGAISLSGRALYRRAAV